MIPLEVVLSASLLPTLPDVCCLLLTLKSHPADTEGEIAMVTLLSSEARAGSLGEMNVQLWVIQKIFSTKHNLFTFTVVSFHAYIHFS